MVGEHVRECFEGLGDLRQLEAGHDPFLIWCQVVEQSMADQIREAGLHAPKRFFGRGNRPELKQKQLPRAPRKGRCGDYQPTLATFSVQSRQVVRQYRRLQNLKQMSKATPSESNCVQMQRLWISVARSRGFGDHFLVWAVKNTDLADLLVTVLPTVQDIECIAIAVKKLADAIEKQEVQHRKDAYKQILAFSIQHEGGKLPFLQMKPDRQPQMSGVRVEREVPLTLLRTRSKGRQQFAVDISEVPFPPVQAYSEGQQFHFLKIVPGKSIIGFFPTTMSVPTKITVSGWVYHPVLVATEFFRYWSEFWGQEDEPAAPHLEGLDCLANLDIPPDICTVTGPELSQMIRNTKKVSATASDGWSVAELQHVGSGGFDQLAVILNHITQAECPWPGCMKLARVVLLAKTNSAETISQTRPITILTLTYRLLMRVISRKALAHMAHRLPPGVTGGVPGRAGWHVWYVLQHHIEMAISQSSRVAGSVTDLVKFFNTIPRVQASILLKHVGFSESFVNQWIGFLGELGRSLSIHGCQTRCGFSRQGALEGDPFSVVLAVLIGALWVRCIESSSRARALAIVDNLEFYSTEPNEVLKAVDCTKKFCKTWQVRLDEAKSWSWIVNESPQCKVSMAFAKKSKARDLGAPLRYGKSNQLGILKPRLCDALARLSRLEAMPMPWSVKVNLALSSAYTAGFFGCEIIPIGKKWYQAIRRSTAAAVFRSHPRANHKAECALMGNGCADPLLRVTKKLVHAARRCLCAFPEHQSTFFQQLHQASGDPIKSYGPAAVLKYYLAQFKVQVCPGGWLTFHGGIQLHLIYVYNRSTK